MEKTAGALVTKPGRYGCSWRPRENGRFIAERRFIAEWARHRRMGAESRTGSGIADRFNTRDQIQHRVSRERLIQLDVNP